MVKNKLDRKPKAIIILGPTASGKTALGVRLAAKFSGEIISADSRQVYRGMDIGTGKDLAEYQFGDQKIPHHLIDIIQPNTKFNLARYQKLAYKAISEVARRGKLPIVVGGSGLYLQAVADNYLLAPIKADAKKRRELEAKDIAELFTLLSQLKPEFAAKLNNSDKNNKRRLVRYLEIASQENSFIPSRQEAPFDFLVIGLEISDEKMREKIERRLDMRLDQEGLIAEVERLHQEGVSYQRLISFGLEYKFVTQFLQGKLSREEMRNKLATAIYRFAKRQKTWFKRWEKQGRNIAWVKDLAEAEYLVKKFI